MKIVVTELGVEIAGRKILHNISARLEGNKMIAIIGSSGSGKTTLLNAIGLIQKVSSGNIFINDKEVTHISDREKSKFWHNYASFIYQDYGIIDQESVLYNITLNKNKSDYKKAQNILATIGLEKRGNDLATVLSGGEKQRLGIARSIYKNSKFIFADEPTASLDSLNRQMVMKLLVERKNAGSMVIIATHDERLIKECDEVIDIEKFNK